MAKKKKITITVDEEPIGTVTGTIYKYDRLGRIVIVLDQKGRTPTKKVRK